MVFARHYLNWMAKKWASVEHYYHANKFKKNNKDYYDKFALGSGSEWEDDPLRL